jgi:hypothetical protein
MCTSGCGLAESRIARRCAFSSDLANSAGEGGRGKGEGRWRPVPSVGGLPFALPTREGVSRPRSPADCRMELALLPTPVLPSVRADAALAELTSAISPREKCANGFFLMVRFRARRKRPPETRVRVARRGRVHGPEMGVAMAARGARAVRRGKLLFVGFLQGWRSVRCASFPGATRRVQPTSHRPRPLGQDVPVHLISQPPQKRLRCRRKAPSVAVASLTSSSSLSAFSHSPRRLRPQHPCALLQRPPCTERIAELEGCRATKGEWGNGEEKVR